jgi:hypothetical protein
MFECEELDGVVRQQHSAQLKQVDAERAKGEGVENNLGNVVAKGFSRFARDRREKSAGEHVPG